MKETNPTAQVVASIKSGIILHEGQVILRNINFDILQGEFVYLIGKTGSGKSSLLKVLYADHDLGGGKGEVVGYPLPVKRQEVPFLRRKLGIIFQEFELFRDRDVADNLMFVLQATGWQEKSRMRNRVEWALSQVGLENAMKKFPHQLSGGEQQRVAIARALLNNPIILLADEPTGNLDPTVANEIMDLFIGINKSGTTVLMATHQHAFLSKFPSRALHCVQGSVENIENKEVAVRFASH